MKSSFCSMGNCVDVEFVSVLEPASGETFAFALVSNSHNAAKKVSFTKQEWEEFVKGAKAGEFDFRG